MKLKKTNNKIRKLWHKVLKGNSSPHEISLGLAIGIFVGFTPLVGVQTILILILIIIIPKINKISVYLSSWVMNQFTFVPIYLLDYWTGSFFLRIERRIEYNEFHNIIIEKNINQIINIGKGIFFPMLLGGVIVGIILGGFTYIIFRIFFERKQKQK